MKTRETFRRPGFTLVEMLVAISILTVIATLSVAVIPKIKERTKAAAGADQLQGWLLVAKQRAQRDRLPTGVRLLFDPNDGYVRSLQYVQQPENFTGGVLNFTNNPKQVVLSSVDPTGGLAPFDQSQWAVQPWFFDAGQPKKEGDYIQIQGGPAVRITNITPGTGPLAGSWIIDTTAPPPFASSPLWTQTSPNQAPPPPTSNYTIIRSPRPIAGEDTLRLPDDVVIDPFLSQPAYFSVFSFFRPYDVLFTPSGPLTGYLGDNNGKIVLWVRDKTQDDPLPVNPQNQPGDQILITVFGRTGRIGGFPWNPDPNVGGGNAYYYVFDPRNSGL